MSSHSESVSHSETIAEVCSHSGDVPPCSICEPPEAQSSARTLSDRELIAELELRLITGALENRYFSEPSTKK